MKLSLTALAVLCLTSGLTAQTTIFELDPSSALSSLGKDTRAMLAADLDGDGDRDLLVGNYAQNNDLFVNRGDGVLATQTGTVLTTVLDNTFGLASGDIDGDGDLDLATANGGGADNGLFRNDGPPGGPWAGRFTTLGSDPVSHGAGDSYAALFSDVDGDGDADLLFANKDVANFLYRNDGSGSFSQDLSSALSGDNSQSRDLAAGDLDGDGDVDLIFANSNHVNFIYTNQGGAQGGTEGDFLALSGDPAVTSVMQSYGTTLADWDNDGDLDLFVANRKDQLNELFSNSGGSFTLDAGQQPSQDGGDSFHGVFGDADGDGDLDLFVANRNQPNVLYLNDGANLTSASSSPVAVESNDSRVGLFADLNADGMNELVVGNTSGQANPLFRNLLSPWVDLGFAFQPSPGDPEPRLSAGGDLSSHSYVHYFVDAGPAAASATLVVGASQIDAPFRGGVLVPAPDLLMPGFSTDASGLIEMTFVVPDMLPSGFIIFHQVWIVDGSSPAGLVATNGLSGSTP